MRLQIQRQIAMGCLLLATTADTWRVAVDLVLVDVAVLDDKGKPMAGLKKGDFRIFQDDKEQQIDTFDVVSEAADKSSLPVSLNDIEERTQRGKVIILLFDQNTIRGADSKLVLDTAEKYVRQHMRPYDLMAVAIYVQSMKITCPLTHDATKVIEAIHHANAAGTGSPPVDDTTGAKELRSRVMDTFHGLKSLCSALEPVRGHKTVLLFTEDISVPSDTLTDFNSLVSAARKSDVSFFTLDARGRSESSTNSASLLGPVSTARPSRTPTVNLAQFQNQTSATIFRSLASQTNGYPIFNTDNLAEALDRVDLELSNYYVLGFHSSTARSDGRPHRIEVKVNLKDAKLKYRETYTDPHPTDPLADPRVRVPCGLPYPPRLLRSSCRYPSVRSISTNLLKLPKFPFLSRSGAAASHSKRKSGNGRGVRASWEWLWEKTKSWPPVSAGRLVWPLTTPTQRLSAIRI